MELDKKRIMESADPELLKKLQGKTVLIKFGGNAMVNDAARDSVLRQIAGLKEVGLLPVVVHGGGPFIKKMLDDAGIKSEFIGGHRVTERNAMQVVELALSGRVNGEVVKELNKLNAGAVGLSGKDGPMVVASKRQHSITKNKKVHNVDLGFVGDVKSVDTTIIEELLKLNYLPVISPIAAGEDGEDYNVNADMCAGHLAGALNAEAFVAITNIDGLLRDVDDPNSKIETLSAEEAEALFGTVIQGGMIPKIEACIIGLKSGVKAAHIVNGATESSLINQLLTNSKPGTTIE